MVSAFLHPFAKPTRTDFRTLVRGQGAMVYDNQGNQYIDGMASLWYCAVGHGRSDMAESIARQAGTLAAYSTFDPFTNEPAEQLAEKLVSIGPMPDARVFFTSSGSEAVDTAMKLARLAHVQAGQPERTLIISRQRGYHGTAYGGTSAQGIPPNREGYGPLVGDVVQVPADDVEALATLMSQCGNTIASVLVEPLQGAGGVFPPTEGYLESVRRLCDQHGAFLIYDEVISGFGRLGTWFAAHKYDVRPDMVTFAKAVTSGYQPLGGVFVGPAVRQPLEADPAFFLRTGFTYSGHPTACAAALTNIDILEREDMLNRSLHIGKRLSTGLQALADDGMVAAIRGDGSVWAVSHHPHNDPVVIRDRMMDLGVITRAIGADANTFCPSFVISDAQIDQIIDVLATALKAN
ncbi:MAG: aminotransferase class III-fold pyridoxal phosphate-dependent enzyme [Actinomycetota bacterium]|nr:aminotransferase class III-fold pyridoxal phosphate-dependent enzyme [Actinomycetota bacterium]MDA3019485.1 aminotransferase class III-fold pyridoxal phosphate-dependent enzyme [Actinomycetota bacterium]